MNPQDVIDTVAAFEQDLAAFYKRIETEARFQQVSAELRYMHQHCAIHAQLIRNYRPDARLPRLNLDPMLQLHTRLKTVLHQQLMDTQDVSEACNQLGQAEALLSRAYTVMAENFHKTADVYTKLAHKFESLAADEMQHHDHLLKRAPKSAGEPRGSAGETEG